MRVVSDDIGKVFARMRPLDIKYGQPAIDYLAAFAVPSFPDLMPYYEAGHRLAIAQSLIVKDKDEVFQYQKYPLGALRMDIQEEVMDGMIHYRMNLVILALTKHEYTYEERLANVFKPILIPLYERFMNELGKVGVFSWPKGKRPKHKRFLRPYWGAQYNEGNKAFLFCDPLDAIEILDLEVSAQEAC